MDKLPKIILLMAVSALTGPVVAMDWTSPSRPATPPLAQPSAYDLGVKAVHAGDYPRALGYLQKAVEANANDADAWNYIGYSQRNLQHFDESLAAYEKALAINPDHRGANEYLGELYLKTGHLEKAQERLAKLQSLCPGGCEEYDDLSKAVNTYKTAQK
jgi:tetratricopeptide (TPR) repeat protein